MQYSDIYQELQILSSDSEERIIVTRRAVIEVAGIEFIDNINVKQAEVKVAGMEFIDKINVKQAEVNNIMAAMVTDMEAMVKPGEGDPTVKDSSE